jgi:HlyD family secretion protein
MWTTSKHRLRNVGRAVVAMIAILFGPALALPLATFATGKNSTAIPAEGFGVVTRGPMEMVVSQIGTIESADSVVLVNHCEWSTELIFIVPKGSWVKRGEIVAELDSSWLRETARQRTILLINAEAALNRARKDLRIQELTNESRIAAAELRNRLAQLQRDGYQEAEYPQRRNTLESALVLAEVAVDRAQRRFDFVDKMVERGYRTPYDREAERLKLLAARHQRDLAEQRLRILTKFAHERTTTNLAALAEEAERDLKRVRASARAAMHTHTVRVQSRQASYQTHRRFLDRLQRSIEACVIRAPSDGEVVYGRASSRRSSKRLEVGDRVRYLQPIAMLPDRHHLQIVLRIHESKIRFIEPGAPVVVQADAAHGEPFLGHVSDVSTVPVSGQFPKFDLREHKVVAEMEPDPRKARQLAPGMTVAADIIAARRQDAIRVPVHSVVQVAGRHVAFVRQGEDVNARKVRIGLVSDESIEILDGLEEGEEVVLRPRVTCAQRLAALEARWLAENTSDPEDRWIGWNIWK